MRTLMGEIFAGRNFRVGFNFASFFENFRELVRMKNFARINFRDLAPQKYFARIYFHEYTKAKYFARIMRENFSRRKFLPLKYMLQNVEDKILGGLII